MAGGRDVPCTGAPGVRACPASFDRYRFHFVGEMSELPGGDALYNCMMRKTDVWKLAVIASLCFSQMHRPTLPVNLFSPNARLSARQPTRPWFTKKGYYLHTPQARWSGSPWSLDFFRSLSWLLCTYITLWLCPHGVHLALPMGHFTPPNRERRKLKV